MRIVVFFLFLLSTPLQAQHPVTVAEALMGKALAEDTKFIRLPGLTNENYLFADETGMRYVLRIPGFGTNTYIDRTRETINSKEAADFGFSPIVIVHSDPGGHQITKYIENFTSYSLEDFYETAMIQQAALLLKKIHTSNLNFKNSIDVFERIDTLAAFLGEQGVQFPPDFYRLQALLSPLRQDLKLPCFLQVPSHGDPVPSNFMSITGTLMLLDWEYSGLNDPAWDLAFLSSIMNYSEDMEDQLLSFYKDPDPLTLSAKMYLFKPIAEYWLALWGLSQTITSAAHQKEFFHYFSCARLGRAQRLFASTAFKKAKDLLLSWDQNPFYEANGQLYLKFSFDQDNSLQENSLITTFPKLSNTIGLTPVQFGLWICPYCGILNPTGKRCCLSPNCTKK